MRAMCVCQWPIRYVRLHPGRAEDVSEREPRFVHRCGVLARLGLERFRRLLQLRRGGGCTRLRSVAKRGKLL